MAVAVNIPMTEGIWTPWCRPDNFHVAYVHSRKLCCEHGVITHNGEKKDYWVPSDKYLIVAGKDEVCNIPPAIAKIRAMVQAGEYDPKKQVRISYAKYHEITIGASSPCKRNICSCKRGCTKSCGCRRKNLKCTSSCGCSGTCMPEDL